MKTVRLVHIKIQDFKSFELAEAAFPVRGFNFLGGHNAVEPRLGANGAGKSSFWDAIVFALYGTDALGNRAADLTTWGLKRCYVNLCLEVDDVEYDLDRWGSPNTLHINNTPAEQSTLDELLGLNRVRFLQSVLFAQKAPQFLDMTAPQRGELMDDVLDLGYWMERAELASKLASGYRDEIRTLDLQKAGYQARIKPQEALDRINAKYDGWKEEHDNSLAELNSWIENLGEVADKADDEIARIRDILRKLPDPDEHSNELDKMQIEAAQLYQEKIADKTRYEAVLKRNFFFRDESVCPRCDQPISKHHKAEVTARNEAELDSLRYEQNKRDLESNRLHEEIEYFKEETRKRGDAKRKWTDALKDQELSLASDRRVLAVKVSQLGDVLAQTNPHEAELQEFLEEQGKAAEEVKRLEETLTREHEELRRMDYWRTGFRKVRLFLVKQALDVLSLETANAASALGLTDWTIDYVTEVETKSGNLRAGIQVLITSPHVGGAWKLQSGGEEQRIRMAVTIGIASMIQRMAGVFYNFEVWDEPTAHLSPEGITDMLDALRYRADDGKVVWIVDHQALGFGSFDETWLVTKNVKTGSTIERVATEYA